MNINLNIYNSLNSTNNLDANKNINQGNFGNVNISNENESSKIEIQDIYSSNTAKDEFNSTNYALALKNSLQSKDNKQVTTYKPNVQSLETKTKGKLSPAEEEQINKLKEVDAKVKQHEAAHLAAAGSLATGGATYTYQTGPDGKQYAVGGEVQISLSSSDNPDETVRNMQTAQRAALAPADPSSQDRSVAQQAAKLEAQASSEKRNPDKEQGNSENKIKNSDEKISNQNQSKENEVNYLNKNQDKSNPLLLKDAKTNKQNDLYAKIISKYIQSSGSIPLGKNIYSVA